MQRSYSASFPGNPSGMSLTDATPPSTNPYRTQGVYSIIPMSIVDSPAIDEPPWRILAVATRARLIICTVGQAGYGKWGKIVAGLTSQNPGVNVFGINEAPDPTLTSALWDPATDPLPPLVASNPSSDIPPLTYLPVSSVLQLPQPLVITAGMSLPNLGLWITPSLLGIQTSAGVGLIMMIFNPTMTVYYDDGKPGH